MSIFGKPKNSKHFLVLDFGSSCIKALIFQRPKNGDPLKIIGAGSSIQNRSDMRFGVVTNISGVAATAKEAIKEAQADCRVKPKEIYVGVSGQLVRGTSTTIRLRRDTPNSPITESELKTVATKIKEKAFQEASKKAAHLTGDPNIDIQVIESNLATVKVDGYYTRNLLELTAKVLEPTIFTAFCPKSHLQNLQSVLKKLKLKPTAILSNLSTIVNLVQNDDPVELNALVIDIGGNTTDIAVVFGGSIVATRTISFGGTDFTQAVISDFNLPFEEAEEKKIKFSSGEISGEKASQIRGALKPAVERWCSGLEVALGDFEKVKIFPDKIVLAGGGSALPDLREALMARPWARDFNFTSFPKLEHLNIGTLKGKLVDETEKLVEEADVVPASFGLTASKLYKNTGNAQHYFRV